MAVTRALFCSFTIQHGAHWHPDRYAFPLDDTKLDRPTFCMLMRNAYGRWRSSFSAANLLLAILVLSLGLSGCGSNSIADKAGSGGSGSSASVNASGNWQITLKPTTGSTLFPYLSGYIQQDITDAGATNYVSEEFSATATSGCYAGINAIPGSGQIDGTQLSLNSFSVNGQYLDIYGTVDSTGSTLTGTYQVTGGCAGGAQGNVTGTRYAPLTGTYTGSMAAVSGGTISLTLQQNSLGNGNGQFEIGGTAIFTGLSCFTSGVLAGPSGWVSGSMVQLTFGSSDSSGAQVVLQGTIDPAVDTLSIASINVTAGGCVGQYGTATLTKQ